MDDFFVIDKNEALYVNARLKLIIHKEGCEIFSLNNETVFAYEKNVTFDHIKVLGKVTQISNAKIYINNLNFTLIPKDIYLENELSTYLELNTGKKLNHLNLSNHCSKYSLTLCFQEENEKINRLKALIPNADFFHISTFLLDNLQNGFNIFFINNIMYIGVLNETRLMFFNGFEINNKEESLYYLSLTCEKLRLKFNHTIFNVYFGAKLKTYRPFWGDYISSKHLVHIEDRISFTPDLLKEQIPYPL